MLDDQHGFLLSEFDRTDPAYWAITDPEAYYGEPPISPQSQRLFDKAAKLTLDQRIQMRIKHGNNWHNKL